MSGVKDKAFLRKTSLNLKGELVFLDEPMIMGILNRTPDSFFDGGHYDSEEELLARAAQMLEDGASILDVGGYSSRPGAPEVSVEEELDRVLPTIEALNKHLPDAYISIDTFRAEVATQAVAAGAAMINDIAGGDLDDNMFRCVSKLKVPYIAMHMQGTPQTMQQSPTYSNVVTEVIHSLSEKVNRLKLLGVNDVILDPGFGFGKTLEHNYQLLNNIQQLHFLNCPVLVGVSRKSMINKIIQTTPDQSLNGTTVVNTMALLNGANLLRVHDVKPAMEALKIVSFATHQASQH